MKNLATPDITLAQILAAITWVVGQLVTMGVVDNAQSQFILSLSTTAITAAWVIADSVIRHGRSKAVAAAVAANPRA